ncbi:APC family permease [Niveibacterium umoris]|uniref:Amino acid transporter n=1 Tax=Niveibacterium umoris TaxID=1193620 RepID=A0A840BGY4_9RHOO|nr:APC family permease [Niveibacterium umoris]MBB4010862.1 amino acid transporter [Niveibacterium umoris]
MQRNSPPAHAQHHARLHEDALGIEESVVMGVAGTAPAFSVAATTATLVAAVGILSAGSLLYCGLIMFGVTFAFMHLNRVITNAGASYAWVGEVFGPLFGFIAGWSLLVASAVFMVSGTIPAATATLILISPEHAANPTTVSFVAAGWLLAVSSVIVKGIKPTSYTQIVMTAIEVGVLVIVIVASVWQYAAHPAHPFSWKWLSIAEFTPSLFATGALTALFFFWGWDVTLNLNEETRDAAHAPGRGAVVAMVIVLLLFISFAIAALLVLSDEEIAQSSTNVVFALAEKLLPRPWSYLAVVAVMLSSVGTLETSILQFTRTMYAKGRDGALHPRYAVLHKSWRTPWVATSVIVVLGLLLLFLSSYFPTVNDIIKDSVNAIGFQVACYYSLAGLACVWHFRKTALRSADNFVFLFLWPGLSAAFLIFIALYSVPTFDLATNIVGIGGIALGVIPWALNRRRARVAVRPRQK